MSRRYTGSVHLAASWPLVAFAITVGCGSDSGGGSAATGGTAAGGLDPSGLGGTGGSVISSGTTSTGGTSAGGTGTSSGGTPWGTAGTGTGGTGTGGTSTAGTSSGGTGTAGTSTGGTPWGTAGTGTSAGTGGTAGTGTDSGGTAGSGGTAWGTAGSAGTAGTAAAGTAGSAGSGTTLPDGDLSINDPTPGYASVEGGTTGGGTNLDSAITVRNMGELRSAAESGSPAIILVEPGDYRGKLAPHSNKTIIGTGPGVTLTGSLSISGDDVSNVIVRNIAVHGERCGSYEECKAGADAVYVGNGAHHVWLDHLDVADGQDGNCDVTQGGNFVTISWSNFYYTYNKEHRFSNLIAGGDDETRSIGKLRITYMNCHWGERVDQRQPRGRFGNIHMLNNYHNTGGSQIHGVGVDMALIAENCVYDENRSIWKDMGSPRGWRGIGNEGTASDMNASYGTVFDVPYDYTAMPASQVVAAVTSPDCGAGNSCTFAR